MHTSSLLKISAVAREGAHAAGDKGVAKMVASVLRWWLVCTHTGDDSKCDASAVPT
jgi:hypothetical protein